MGHAEVTLHAATDIFALVVTQEDHGVRTYLRQPPAYRGVVRAQSVTGELVEVVCQRVAVRAETRAIRVAGDLDALVRSQIRVDPPLGGIQSLFEARYLPLQLFVRSREPV
jgi:hypothetical protein